MFLAPGQWPGTDVPEQDEVDLHVPLFPLALHVVARTNLKMSHT